MAFVLFVITRWGSQYGLVVSVLKNKQALFAWLLDSRVEVGKKKGDNTLRPTIVDQDFQTKLAELAEILELIHKAQKRSESNDATLAHVVPYWLQLEHDLKAQANLYPYLKPILALGGVFNKWLNTQTQPIHQAAFLLNPISSLQYIDENGKEAAIQWILNHVKDQKVVHCSI